VKKNQSARLLGKKDTMGLPRFRIPPRATYVAGALSLSLALVTAKAGAQPPPPGPPPAGPPGGPCPTVLASVTTTIDSKLVRAGDIFRFATIAPVPWGATAIPVGTRGVGVVETFDHAKSESHSGYLVLEARYIELADGSHVPAALIPGPDGRSQSFVRGGYTGSGFLEILPYYIGTAAGVYDVLHRGKEAALIAGTRLALVVGDGFYTGSCRIPIER
jgi:hypothetical protein